MLESSTSMNMTGLTQPRPRTSETEGLLTQSSAPNVTQLAEEESSEHGNAGSPWVTHVQVSIANAAFPAGPVLLHTSDTFGLHNEYCMVCLMHPST